MGSGMDMAYRHAVKKAGGNVVSRVIVLTDGDTNIGPNLSAESMLESIGKYVAEGVTMTTVGFGMGNYRDDLMEKLADKGNGNCFYVEGWQEAKKVFETQLTGTLEVIAKDVKIQVEFNREVVQAWRLIGYENRVLAHQDFNDDAKDAGEIGAGHCVTALYEIVPVGVAFEAPGVDPLRYQAASAPTSAAFSGELLFVKLRHKAPDGTQSELTEVPVLGVAREFARASSELRFASAVAAFGMKLRQSAHAGAIDFGEIRRIASEALGEDAGGYRAEFVELIDRAAAL
jgi:Ca-activated chloride channel family protein